MESSLTKIIFILSALLFALALYLISVNENTLSFNNQTDLHIKIVTIANEIGSYAKRAEGHLFLFLMLKDPIDKNKFFMRMESLKNNILELIQLQNSNKDLNMTKFSHWNYYFK